MKWVKKVKENMDNDILISFHGTRWLVQLVDGHTVRYKEVYSLCHTPETNITNMTFYINYMLKFK